MGLLDKLWDDVVAGPQPELGLSRLRYSGGASLPFQGAPFTHGLVHDSYCLKESEKDAARWQAGVIGSNDLRPAVDTVARTKTPSVSDWLVITILDS